MQSWPSTTVIRPQAGESSVLHWALLALLLLGVVLCDNLHGAHVDLRGFSAATVGLDQDGAPPLVDDEGLALKQRRRADSSVAESAQAKSGRPASSPQAFLPPAPAHRLALQPALARVARAQPFNAADPGHRPYRGRGPPATA